MSNAGASLVVVLAVSAVLAGCSSMSGSEPGLGKLAGPGPVDEELLERARAARRNGEIETATRLYRAAIKDADKEQPRLRVELGELLTDAGDYDQAFEAINASVKATDDATRELAFAALGRLYFKLRRPTESATFFDKALELNPGNAKALIGRGVALDLSGRFEQAQDSYLRALAILPGDLRAQNNLALSYAFGGNYAKAVEILHPLATSPAATPRLRQNLALVYGLMGNGELAASIARRDLDEGTVQSNLRFYEILRRMPNPAEALAGAGG